VQSAQVAATEGHEQALRHLAAQRREAVERHMAEVLGTLDKSLAMVGQVFVDPARKAMLDATAPRPEASSAVLEGATALAPVEARARAGSGAVGPGRRARADPARVLRRGALGLPRGLELGPGAARGRRGDESPRGDGSAARQRLLRAALCGAAGRSACPRDLGAFPARERRGRLRGRGRRRPAGRPVLRRAHAGPRVQGIVSPAGRVRAGRARALDVHPLR
jgi:hypothetical protein